MIPSSFLSKSQYLRGQYCLKRMCLSGCLPLHEQTLPADEPKALGRGKDVSLLARSLFKGGIDIPYDQITFEEQSSLTKSAMQNMTNSIYGATFLYDGLCARVDILARELQAWSIYKVKCSEFIGDKHYQDLAFQYYVLDLQGITIDRVAIIHCNYEYRRLGDIDASKLFSVVDCTGEVLELLSAVRASISELRRTMHDGIPYVDIGPHCADPFRCNFISHCWRYIPNVSVFSLIAPGVNRLEFYLNGITRLEDLPINELPGMARVEVVSYLNKTDHVDRHYLKSFLDSLWYPLVYVDIVTSTSPIPPFDNVSPYEAVPMQYTLRIQYVKGGPLTCRHFLGEHDIDARMNIIERLINDMPAKACVVGNVECLNQSGDLFPEYREAIDSIVSNTVYLHEPFSRHAYFSWRMMGRDIQGGWMKRALKALAPEFSYNASEVNIYEEAVDIQHKMSQVSNLHELNEIRNNLRKRSEIKTLAMVKILERLYELSD